MTHFSKKTHSAVPSKKRASRKYYVKVSGEESGKDTSGEPGSSGPLFSGLLLILAICYLIYKISQYF